MNRIETVKIFVPSGRTRTGSTRAVVTVRSHPTRDPQRTGIDAPTRSSLLSHARSPAGICSHSHESLSVAPLVRMLHPRASLLTSPLGGAPSIPASPVISISPRMSQSTSLPLPPHTGDKNEDDHNCGSNEVDRSSSSSGSKFCSPPPPPLIWI